MLILGNKCIIWRVMLIMGEIMHVGGGSIREISVISSQFCCEPKVALLKLF